MSFWAECRSKRLSKSIPTIRSLLFSSHSSAPEELSFTNVTPTRCCEVRNSCAPFSTIHFVFCGYSSIPGTGILNVKAWWNFANSRVTCWQVAMFHAQSLFLDNPARNPAVCLGVRLLICAAGQSHPDPAVGMEQRKPEPLIGGGGGRGCPAAVFRVVTGKGEPVRLLAADA